MAQTGQRAAAFLQRLLSARAPVHAFRQAPYLIPMPWQSTLAEPMASLMAAAQTLAGPDVWEAEITPGFPLADVADSGPAVLVYADTRQSADAAAQKLYDRLMRAQRSEEHTSELQSLMRISYAVFCLKKTQTYMTTSNQNQHHSY